MKEIACGIYCISNLKNGKKYIGQSIDIFRRWREHRELLDRGQHGNTHLQEDYNLYGSNAFSFYVVEHCERNNLALFECYHIRKLSTYMPEKGYNLGTPYSRKEWETIVLREAKEREYEELKLKEKEGIANLLEEHLDTRLFKEDIIKFQKDFFDRIFLSKNTNYRKHGIRSIVSIIEEYNLPYAVISGQSNHKTTKGKRYWKVVKADF